MKKISFLIVFLCIAGLVAFLPNKQEIQTAKRFRPLITGITTEIIATLPYLAKSEGFFEKRGLDVRFIFYPSGKRALKEGLLKNEADFITTAEVPAVFASMTRDDFAIFATIAVSDNDVAVVARRDSGIRSIDDLKGKRIATQRASAVHFFLYNFLKKNRILDVDASYMKAELLPTHLAENRIDAFSMREPFTSEAQALLGVS